MEDERCMHDRSRRSKTVIVPGTGPAFADASAPAWWVRNGKLSDGREAEIRSRPEP